MYKIPLWAVILWTLLSFWMWNNSIDSQYIKCDNVEKQLAEYKLAFPKFHSRFEKGKINE